MRIPAEQLQDELLPAELTEELFAPDCELEELLVKASLLDDHDDDDDDDDDDDEVEDGCHDEDDDALNDEDMRNLS